MNKPFAPLSREEIAIRALGLRRDPLAGELIALEPRMVFDGAGVAIVADAAKQASDSVDTGQTDSTAKSAADLTKMMAAASVPPTPAAPAPVEVVFIDSRVSDIDAFKKTAGDNRLIVVVDAQDDGITKITDTLKGLHDISAVHIVGHGVEGSFELGKNWIGVDAIKAHEADMNSWTQSLAVGADILLYGCDVAKGTDGETLIKTLSQETGRDVAASADAVGFTNHGADWTLEKTTGVIEAKVLAPENYVHELAPAAAPTVDANFLDDKTPNFTPSSLTVSVGFKAGADVPTASWTNDTTPTFSGSASAVGATVRLYAIDSSLNKIKLLGTATADASSKYKISPDINNALSEGTVRLAITQEYSGFTESAITSDASFYIHIRTTAPTVLDTTNNTILSGNASTPYTSFDSSVSVTTNTLFRINLTADQVSKLTNIGGAIRTIRFNADGSVLSSRNDVWSSGNLINLNLLANSNYKNISTTSGILQSNDTYYLYLVDSAGNFIDGTAASSTGVPTSKSGMAVNIKILQMSTPSLGGFTDNSGTVTDVAFTSTQATPATDDATPTFYGTDLPSGSTLTVKVAGPTGSGVNYTLTNVAPTSNDIVNNKWTYELPSLANNIDGKYTVTFTANATVAGQSVQSGTFVMSFYKDTADPTFTISDRFGTTQSDTVTTGSLVDGLTLTGFATTSNGITTTTTKQPGSTLTIDVYTREVTVKTDATSKQLVYSYGPLVKKSTPYITTVNADGSWSYGVPSSDFGNGFIAISFIVTDAQNKTSSSAETTVYFTGAWSPGGLGQDSLLLWLDPSITSSVKTTGNAVNQLNDLSGNGNNAKQNTTGNQPVYATDPATGRKYLSFVGVPTFTVSGSTTTYSINTASSDYLSLSSILTPRTLFYVGQSSAQYVDPLSQQPQVADKNGPFNSFSSGTGPNSYGFFTTNDAADGIGFVGQSGTTGKLVSASGQSWVIGSASSPYISGDGVTTSIMVNGVTYAGSSISSTNIATIGSIGARFTGQMGAVIAYNRTLTSAETTILANAESQAYILSLASGVSDLYVVNAVASASATAKAALQLAYASDIDGILKDGASASTAKTSSANGGLIISDAGFFAAAGSATASIMFGNDGADPQFKAVDATVNPGNPGVTRFTRSWAVDVSGGSGGKVDVSFDVASLAAQSGQTVQQVSDTYSGRSGMSLAWRATESDAWQVIATSSSDVLATGGKISFAGVDVGAAGLRDGFVTLMDGPIVKGITNSASGTVTAPTTTFRVEFSESVVNLKTTNFTLSTTSTDTKNSPRVLSIAGQTTGTESIKSNYDSVSGKYYVDVTVSVGSGSGDLTLDYNFAGFDAATNKTGVDEGAQNSGNPMVKTAYTTSPVAFNYNLTAPTIDSFKDDVGTVVPNTAASGTFTDDTLPLLKGTAAANTQVNIYLDGSTTILASVNSDSNGLWSYQVASALAEGARKFSAKTQDSLGNLSSSTSDFTINVDVTAPAKPTLALASDTGTSASDNYSTNGRINVTNIESTGSWQYSTDGGTTWSEAQASSLGFFTLAPGDYLGSTAVAVRQIDAAGNVSQSTMLPETHIDVTKPSAPSLSLNSDTGSSSSDLITKDNIIKVTGLEDGASWEYKIGTGAWTAGSGATFTLSTDGTYAIGDLQVRQTDKAGNLSDAGSNAAAIKLDRVAPTYGAQLSFTSGTLTSGNSTLTYIRQTSWRIDTLDPVYGYAADEKPQISIDGGLTFADLRPVRQNNGVYYYFWDFNDGDVFAANKVVLQVVDAAGNIKSGSALPTKYVVDITPPSVPVITGFTDNVGNLKDNFTTANVTTDDPTPTFYGTSEAGSTVYVRYNLIKADGSFGPGVTGSVTLGATQTNWSYTPAANMASGSYSVVAYAVDIAGNSGLTSTSFLLSVDTSTPAVPVISGFVDDIGNVTSTSASPSVSGVTTDDTSPLLVGTAGGAGKIDIYEGTTKVGSAIVDTSGTTKTWSYQLTGVTAGTHNYTAKYVNAAGSESAATSAFTIKVDTTVVTAPTIALPNDTGKFGNDFVTNDGIVNVSGLVSGATWQYSLNKGVTWFTGSGTSFTLPQLTGGNKYQIGDIQVRQTSASGNVSAVTSNSQVIWIDMTPPSSSGSIKFPDSNVDNSIPNSNKIVGANFFYASDFDAQTSGGYLRYSLDSGTTWQLSTDGFVYLQDGFYPKNTIKTQLIDLAGNASSIGGITTDLTVINTPPDALVLTLPAETGVSLIDGVMKNKTVTVSSLVSIRADWEYSIDGGVNFTQGSGTSFDLGDGTYASGQIQVRQTYFGLVSAISSNSAALTIDTSAPEVTWVADKTSLKAGETTTITFTASESIDGLTATDFTVSGGTLSAFTQSSTNAKVYTATFSPATNFNGTATVTLTGAYTDIAGNAGTLKTPVSLSVDTTAPSLSSLAITATGGQNNYLNAGDVVTVTATFTQSVTVTGTPRVALNIGGVTRYATYKSGDGTTGLTFTYTIASGDTDSNGISIDANKLELNGATLIGSSGNNVVLDHAAVSDNATLMVDTAAPTITISSSQPALKIGETATITFTVSESVLGLDASDFTVSNGALSNFARVGTSNVYTATFTPSSSFEGSANLSFGGSYTDLAGNEGLAPPSSLSLAVDTKAPTTPAIHSVNDNVDPVQGTVANNGFTNDTTPTLTITAEAGSVVKVYDGSTLLGTATETSTAGTYNFTTSALSSGSHTFTVKATDVAGNESAASATYAVTIDASAPSTPTITSVTDNVDPVQGVVVNSGATNDTTPTLTITAETGSVVKVYDGTTLLGTATETSTAGTFTYTTSALNSGNHSFTVKATDAAGNESSQSSAYAVSIDTTTPATPTITSVTDNVDPVQGIVANSSATNDTTPTLTITAETGSVVKVYDGSTLLGTATETSTSGIFTFTTAALSNGGHSFTVKSSDSAGNESGVSNSYTVTIDASAPAKPVISNLNDDASPVTGTVSNNGYTNDTTPTLTITAESGSVVRVYDGSTLLGTATETSTLGTYTFTTANLTADVHAFTVKATDAAGNESVASSSFTITIDTTKPPAPVLTLSTDSGSNGSDRLTNDATMTLTAEAGTSVVVTFKNGTKTVTKPTYTGGGATPLLISLTPQDLADLGDGPLTVTAVATDAAGNASDAATSNFTLDRTAPTLALSTSATSLKAGEFATITFTLSEAVTGLDVSDFDVTNGSLSNLVQSTTDPKVYTATFTPKTSFNGTGKIEFKTTGSFADIAGNAGNAQSVTSGPLSFALDTTAASISSVALTSQTGAQNNYLNEGDTVTATVTFTEAVNVTSGTPQLAFKIGNDTKYAIFKGGSGTSSLTFTYSIGAGETDTNGISLDASVLTLNGAAITTKSSGNSVVLGHAPVADNATYRVDTTKPDAPVLALGTGVADGATSAEATATGGVVTLTAESGSSVVVTFTNGTKTITKNVTGNGATPVAALLTTADLASLGDGTISVSAKATDLAGNVSDAGSTSFTLDTVKPTKPVVTPGPGVDDGATGEEAKQDKGVVTVTADPDTDVTVTFTNGTKKVNKTVKGGGATPVPVILTQDDINTLGDGPITVSAIAKDAAGNDSDGGTTSFTLDTVAPKLTVTSSATALKIGETAILTFEASEDVLDLTIDDFNVTHGTLSNFVRSSTNPKIFTATFTPEAGFEGQAGVTLKGSFTDKAGNAGSLNSFAGIAIDTNAPAVALTSYDDNVDPQSGNFALSTPTNDTTPTFNGTGEAGAKVEMFRRDGANLVSLGTTTIVNGKWSITPGSALGEGTYQIFARVTDSAGNSADTANSTLVIDQGTSGKLDGFDDGTGTPDVAKPFDGPAQSTDVKFVGQAEKGARVDVYRRDGNKVVLIGSGTSDPQTGKYSVRNSVSLDEGDSTIFVRITDAAGNSVDTADSKLTISLPRAPSASPEPVVVTETPKPVVPAVFPKPEAQADNQVSSTFGVPLGSVFDVKTVNSIVVTTDGKAFRRDVTGSVGDAASPIQQIPAVEYASYLRPAFVEVGILVRERGAAFVQAREDLPQIDVVKITSRPEVAPYIEDTKTGRILVRRDGPSEVRMEIEITMRDGTVIRQQIRVDTKSGQFTVNSPDGAWLMPQSLDQQLAGLLWGDVTELADLLAEELG